MKKVITYGTYDLLHHGHIRLLERARLLGDYLIVGVTSDDYDRVRGKINVQQPLEDRLAAVEATGLADKIIVEEYEGQKIDDINKYDIDVFTVGSDWEGYFDYLGEYCEVVYLPRTAGVSSSDIRSVQSRVRLGMVGYSSVLDKFFNESSFVNGVDVVALCTDDGRAISAASSLEMVTNDYDAMLAYVDAVYVHSYPNLHYSQTKTALACGKHVLCESPLALDSESSAELIALAEDNGCVLMEAIRTAYVTAYNRMLLRVKSGHIGNVVSVNSTCTSLSSAGNFGQSGRRWGAFEAWGPTALVPIFQLLGTECITRNAFFITDSENRELDVFAKVDFTYENATASAMVGTGAKSEGDLVVSGTKGYVYVPAPWWKTDYYEFRYEDPQANKREFYQLNGEGIRYELVAFVRAIRDGQTDFHISRNVTSAIADSVGWFYQSLNR